MNIQSNTEPLSRKDREKLRNKNAILEAAVHLFAKNGFADTTLDEVASLSEFGKGTLYNYFENKSDLLLSSVDFAIGKVQDYLNDQLESVSDPLDRIRLIVNSQFEYYRTNADFLRVVISNQRIIGECMHQSGGKQLQQRFSGLREMLVSEIQKGIETGILKSGNAERYAAYLSGMIHGQVRSLTMGEIDLDTVQPDEILDIFLNGVKHD